MIVDQTALA